MASINYTRTIRDRAHELALATQDAYSFARFGLGAWRQCCAILLRRGYTEARAEAILRSTLMRYAADDARGFYRATSADMVRLLDQPSTADYLEELFAETETPEPTPSRQALRLVWSR
jgi:hypothetical protein